MIKVCHVCGLEKEHKSWKATTCNDCLDAGYKACTQCGDTLPITDFHTCRGKPLGMCKSCECARSKADKQRSGYYLRPDIKERRNQASRECHKARLSNNETRRIVYDRHNEVKRERYANDADYRQSLKEQSRLYVTKRKDAGHYSATEWHAAADAFNYTCAYCGAATELTQDHVVALSKGGSNTAENIVPCCRSCNSSKRDRDMIMWYSAQPFYSKERLETILKFLKSRM